MGSAQQNVARLLAPYQRIAVWGAGSLATLAMDRWLPRERVTAVLDPPRLVALFDPGGYLGSARAFVQRAVSAHLRASEE